MRSTRYAPAVPVSLASTLRPLRRGHHDPTFRVLPDGVWRTLRAPTGAATMNLRVHDSGVEVTAWGPGAEWAIAGVPALLGAGDDWSDLDVTSVPLLADSLRRNPGLRLLRTELVFEMLLPSILEQKVTGIEARRAWRALLAEFGDVPPGPAPEGMRVFPAAEVWRRVPSWAWHRAGAGPQRADAIMKAATVASSLERTLTLGRGGAEVERRLRSLPGVGVWTAAETMQRSHGDPDSPSVGDYHLPAVAGWALIGRPVDDAGMLELLAPWAGQRQRIMRLIEVSGFSKPKFGPRMTIQDHRRH